ncbi:MAG TPA: GIY-YIG nuclease family protein, partial [Armatimonadota bacterium]|nr:GIY-YIG nuclease family protein [Armatimonadota bacterium]
GEMMILLNDLLRIDDAHQYKLHLACRNEDGINPLDEYVTSYSQWQSWNEWKGTKNDWTRDYVCAFMEFYPKRDHWLFGGVYKVLERGDRYTLEKDHTFEKYEGRLLVHFHRYQGMRGRGFRLENYLEDLEIAEILPRPYTGENFCGYENINHDFNMLKVIYKNDRADWKAALSSIKGVYLISDKSNGKLYIGSAYGGMGIWSRWACYLETGHGGNEELMNLIGRNGIQYARRNFKFSILEVMSMSMPDDLVIARESYWKSILLTREYGYNKN